MTFYSTKDLAARWHTNENRIRIWRREGKIPSGMLIGKQILWTIQEIEEFEQQRKDKESVRIQENN